MNGRSYKEIVIYIAHKDQLLKHKNQNIDSLGVLNLIRDPEFPLSNSYSVSTIVVNKDQRGQGIAKALYGIALSILKINLLAGDSQTPGGQKNWLKIYSVPGVEVLGFVRFDLYDYQETSSVKKLVASGLHPLGKTNVYDYYTLPVEPSKERLAVAIKNAYKLYGAYSANVGMFARWTGK